MRPIHATRTLSGYFNLSGNHSFPVWEQSVVNLRRAPPLRSRRWQRSCGAGTGRRRRRSRPRPRPPASSPGVGPPLSLGLLGGRVLVPFGVWARVRDFVVASVAFLRLLSVGVIESTITWLLKVPHLRPVLAQPQKGKEEVALGEPGLPLRLPRPRQREAHSQGDPAFHGFPPSSIDASSSSPQPGLVACQPRPASCSE